MDAPAGAVGGEVKLVLNKCFGGFSISRECAELMAANGSERAKAEIAEAEKASRWYGYGYADGFDGGYERSDQHLVKAVEQLGDAASGSSAKLRVVEIPDGIEWELDEYDGVESIHEAHRSWG